MECGVSGVILVIVQLPVGVELRNAHEHVPIQSLSLMGRIVLETLQKVKTVVQIPALVSPM